MREKGSDKYKQKIIERCEIKGEMCRGKREMRTIRNVQSERAKTGIKRKKSERDREGVESVGVLQRQLNNGKESEHDNEGERGRDRDTQS